MVSLRDDRTESDNPRPIDWAAFGATSSSGASWPKDGSPILCRPSAMPFDLDPSRRRPRSRIARADAAGLGTDEVIE
jgi:hypothetical protein